MMDSILFQVFASLGLLGGLGSTLFLFLSLKRQASAAESRWRRQLDSSEAAWKARVDALEAQYRELAEHTRLLVPPAPAASGLNLNKRSQALRMHRQGEPAGRIAAALAVPRGEIDLLLRVHGMVLSAM
ncbi:MAG: hypothetical protein ACRD96_11540 [Bryobacteraceae bacterium]